METIYLKFSTRFRSVTYDFVLSYPSNIKITGVDVQKIVSGKFQTPIPAAEIGFSQREISQEDYENSQVDKCNPYVLAFSDFEIHLN